MTKEEKTLAQFIEAQPLALALPRANESLALKNFKFKEPILDFGCGDGIFARLCFGKKGLTVGLDQNPKEIALARKYQAYKKAVVGTGQNIPYPDNYFQTVLSNSVLEHIKGDLGPVLKEINRVLKRDGVLIVTVPRPVISEHLFYSRVLRKIGLKQLAQKYIDLKQSTWRHYHLLEEPQWRQELQKAGFKVRSSFTLIPQETVTFHDIFCVFGIPYVLNKKLFKNSSVLRPSWLSNFLAKRLVKFCRVYEGLEGTTTCIEAIKIR